MNQKEDDIAHLGMLSKPEKHLILAQFINSPWTGGKSPVSPSFVQNIWGALRPSAQRRSARLTSQDLDLILIGC
jgi:hypothetical protein